MTLRADVFLQKFLHALHALFILDLGKRVLNGIDGVEVGEVQLPRLIGVFRMIEDVLLLRRAVEAYLPLLLCQLTERHVCAHAHLPAHVGHKRPH